MPEFKTLQVEDRGAIRLVTIHRPEVLNAINAEVVDELSQLLEATAAEPELRGFCLTGAGEKSFVAGADITAMSEMSPEEALRFAGKGHAMGEMLAALDIPTVAAVNGFALGGGCELALACDFIYASDNAKFGQPEVKLGVIPGFGGTQRLARRIGIARALELCMSGDLIGSDEALRIGLCNKVFPRDKLLEEALGVLGRIAQMGPLAVAKVKEVIHRGVEMPLPEANLLEQQSFAELFATFDQKHGMQAFLAKQPPQFRGK